MIPGPDDLPGHDDQLHDAVALVSAVLAEDTEGFAAIVPNMNAYGVAVTLAKLLSEVLSEQGIPLEHFRHWSRHAITRS